MTEPRPSHGRQVLGSLLVALAIVAVVIVAVTLRLGPTSVAELEAMQEREELRIERQDELREAGEERREERLERQEEIEEERQDRR